MKLVPNAAGTATATVSITLTREQWMEYERAFRVREMACNIGLDSPQLTDFVMFQVFNGGQFEEVPSV